MSFWLWLFLQGIYQMFGVLGEVMILREYSVLSLGIKLTLTVSAIFNDTRKARRPIYVNENLKIMVYFRSKSLFKQ